MAALLTRSAPRCICSVWGRNMLITLGFDGQNTTNMLSMLDLETMYWDSWDGEHP